MSKLDWNDDLVWDGVKLQTKAEIQRILLVLYGLLALNPHQEKVSMDNPWQSMDLTAGGVILFGPLSQYDL
jgi:hypothetical protein